MDRHEHATLHLPSPALRHCIFMAVERDTRGVTLDARQRFNHYPAAPFPTISWVLHGELRMLDSPADDRAPDLGPPIPDLAFAGPHDIPVASWSPGAVHALTVSVYPEFLARYAGMDLGRFRNRVVPLADVLPSGSALLDTCRKVPTGTGAPFARLETALRSWADTAEASGAIRPSFTSWLAGLGLRAATSPNLAGLRRLQRRVRATTGQSRRDLQLYVRAEHAFRAVAQLHPEGPVAWSTIAHETGFSDQSHLGREVRRISGYSPARLRRTMETDEAFWFYRLIHGYHRGG
ncbi:helix-turn-helix domain-containing protein [Lysobacter korlensis]|uniref:Helix-turn-helix domain-containing protein n=1 Tax=Lysobacter korlensis TaxID=553636 RepID=A0ABV6RS33_9GAMM